MSLRFHPPISPQHSRAGECGQASSRAPVPAEEVRPSRLVVHLPGWTLLEQLATVVGSQEAIMAGDYHVRAAEMHEMAAHAHRAASAGHGKQDHLSGHEQAQRAMEHAAKAFQQSQEALKQSAMYAKPSQTKKG